MDKENKAIRKIQKKAYGEVCFSIIGHWRPASLLNLSRLFKRNYNAGENILNKAKKSSKIEQDYRSSLQRCYIEKVFLEISQNSQENSVSFLSLQLYLKKRLWNSCFPVNFAKVLRTSFLTEHLWRLFLKARKVWYLLLLVFSLLLPKFNF